MPDGWRRVRLAEIALQNRAKVAVREGVTYPGLGVYRDGRGLFAKEPFVGGITSYTSLTRVSAGQLVLRTITAWEAPIGVANESHEGGFVSTVFPVFDLDGERVLPQYMALVCQHPPFWHEMRVRTTGTVMRRKTLSALSLLDIPVDLPPLAEQRRIVDIIRAADAAIDAALATETTASAAWQAYADRCWDDAREEKRLGDLGQALTGSTPSTFESDYWQPEEVPFFSPSDFDGRPILMHAQRYLSRVGAEAARLLTAPSVAQVCIGATYGKAAVLAVDACTNQQVNALTGLDEIDALTITAMLTTAKGQNRLRSIAGLTTMPIVKKSSWVDMQVRWPPRHDRTRLHGLVTAIAGVAASARREASAMRSLRATVMQDLMSGDREVPASYDRYLDDVA